MSDEAGGPQVRMDFENVLSGPLSKEARFALMYSGPYRSREIGNLIKQLTLIKSWLIEEEAEAERAPTPTQQETGNG